MKTDTFGTIGGLKTPIHVYTDMNEILSQVKEEVVVGYLNSHCAYRGPCDTGRELLCELIESETGIERGREVVTDKAGKPRKDAKTGEEIQKFTESPQTYLDRVMEEKKWDDLLAFQSKYDEVCNAYEETDDDDKVVFTGLRVDITEKPRKERQPTRFSKTVINTAKAVLEKGDAQVAKASELCAQAGYTLTLVGDATVDGKVDEKSADFKALCTGIKAYNDWKIKQQQSEFVGA